MLAKIKHSLFYVMTVVGILFILKFLELQQQHLLFCLHLIVNLWLNFIAGTKVLLLK